MPLPKEQQSAYQRWEMASFGDDRAGSLHRMQAASNNSAEHAAQLEAQRESARQQGYQEGLSKGYEAGLAQGRAQAETERQLIQQIAQQFGEEVAKANESIATDVLALALDMAKAMLKTALPARPELILPIVKEAVSYLPTVQQPALLALNPVDAALVQGQMGVELSAAGWRIIEDQHMERGGCRVETASNQIDATAATRWQRLAASLSADNAWIES